MSYVERKSIAITTIADGSATGYVEIDQGRLSQIRYVKTDYTDGVDFAITLEATGEVVWTGTNVNASVTIAPRQATHDVLGAASLYAAAGEPVEDYIAIAKDRIKIVIAQGGDTKSGTFHFVMV